VFRALDSNNDGHFNSYELRNAFNAVGMSVDTDVIRFNASTSFGHSCCIYFSFLVLHSSFISC